MLESGRTNIVLAAGCFWGVEEHFRVVPGVIGTEVGYTGGSSESANYEEVCRGHSGHAEAVRVEFDQAIISLDEILNLFWACHDPSTLNRQGPDVGSQYRSAIFFSTNEHKLAALRSMQAQNQLMNQGHSPRTCCTLIEPLVTFYPAEEYHQQYLRKNS